MNEPLQPLLKFTHAAKNLFEIHHDSTDESLAVMLRPLLAELVHGCCKNLHVLDEALLMMKVGSERHEPVQMIMQKTLASAWLLAIEMHPTYGNEKGLESHFVVEQLTQTQMAGLKAVAAKGGKVGKPVYYVEATLDGKMMHVGPDGRGMLIE